LHGHARAELDVRAHGLPEGLVGGHPRNIQCVHVKLNEADTLLLGNPQPAMDTNEVLESQLSSEAIRTHRTTPP
jgi:hypothetical protein